jgi:aquaporin Z
MLFVALPIDNASINPARSLATAVFGGPDWMAQLWVFILFPLAGAALAALLYPRLFAPAEEASASAAATASPASPASPAPTTIGATSR